MVVTVKAKEAKMLTLPFLLRWARGVSLASASQVQHHSGALIFVVLLMGAAAGFQLNEI